MWCVAVGTVRSVTVSVVTLFASVNLDLLLVLVDLALVGFEVCKVEEVWACVWSDEACGV